MILKVKWALNWQVKALRMSRFMSYPFWARDLQELPIPGTAYSQPSVCCSSIHGWSSPAPVKFSCGDWKCCEVALIFFSLVLAFARSFNLVQKSVVKTSKVAPLQFFKSKGYLPFGRILPRSLTCVKSLYQIFFSFWKSRHICFICQGLNLGCC